MVAVVDLQTDLQRKM